MKTYNTRLVGLKQNQTVRVVDVKLHTRVPRFGEEKPSRFVDQGTRLREVLQILLEQLSRVEVRLDIEKWDDAGFHSIRTLWMIFVLFTDNLLIKIHTMKQT